MDKDLALLSPIKFEQYCKKILENAGFEVETTKVVGDGGIDLIATKKELFTSGKYIIQCKRYAGSVGEPILRDLYGVVTAEKANKGILMTTGYFTSSAISFASDKPLELIDGTTLAKLATSNTSAPTSYQCLFRKSFGVSVEEQRSDYAALKQLLKKDQNNISYLGDMHSMLEWSLYAPIDDLQDIHHVSFDDVVENKKMTIEQLKPIYEGIRANKYFDMMYNCGTAQLYFLEGDMLESLKRYHALIFDPNFVDYTRQTNLETICQVIQNIALIYKLTGNIEKGLELKSKFKEYISLEQQRLNRIDYDMSNELANYATFEISNRFYLMTPISYSHANHSMLLAQYKDSLNSHLESFSILNEYVIDDSDHTQLKCYEHDFMDQYLLIMPISFDETYKASIKDIIRVM